MTEPQGVEMPIDGVVIEFIDPADVAQRVPAEHAARVPSGERAVVMRDGKRPNGPVLYFTEAEWEAFVEGVKNGEFDDLLEDEGDENS